MIYISGQIVAYFKCFDILLFSVTKYNEFETLVNKIPFSCFEWEKLLCNCFLKKCNVIS